MKVLGLDVSFRVQEFQSLGFQVARHRGCLLSLSRPPVVLLVMLFVLFF